MKRIVLLLFLLFLVFPSSALAILGVGVGTGKIIVNDKLKPGTIYKLPPITVINTGTEASDYSVGIGYLEKQPQLRPDKSWFIFSPTLFRLEPSKVQAIDIKLNLPVSVKPGDYFAYVEGFPTIKSKSGSTTIGIAAAAKLYFTIVPANILMGIYYKLVSFWQVYAPWPQRFLILLALIIIGLLIKKNFNISISSKKSGPTNPPPSSNEPYKPKYRSSRKASVDNFDNFIKK